MAHESLPRYRQIADHYRSLILNGELRPGDEVPSERALAASLGVARPTATKALEILRREALVESIRGSGTYVRAGGINRRASDRYLHSRETGRIYARGERALILTAEVTAEVPAEVDAALQLGGGRALKRSRVILADDVPVELSTSWFVEAIGEQAPALLGLERIRVGTLPYVEERIGRRAATAQDRMQARAARPQEAEALGLTENCLPVLVVLHVVLDERDEPLECVEAVYPPEHWAHERRYSLS